MEASVAKEEVVICRLEVRKLGKEVNDLTEPQRLCGPCYGLLSFFKIKLEIHSRFE